MKAEIFAFIFIVLSFSSQATSHALREVNEREKSIKLSKIWHIWGSLFLFLLLTGVNQLMYDYFVYYNSKYVTIGDKIYSVLYCVVYALLIRFAVFNPAYNAIIGRSLFYAGKSNLFDIFENFIVKITANYIPFLFRSLVFVWLLAESIRS